MKSTWVNINSNNKLIIFFNGWGCDEHQFKHLKSDNYDVLMFYDYRTLELEEEILSEIKNYDELFLVAWSYGVWVGQFVCEKYNLKIKRSIAVNGTTQPVHDQYGIAESIVQGTLDNLSERNLMKFQRRMVGGSEAWKNFEADKPLREFEEQKEELAALIDHFKQDINESGFYDKAIVGLNDLIFIANNQKIFWQGRAGIQEIEAPHFCFYDYNSWDELLS
jgi:biotin synthesis protein BioG